MKDLLLCLLFTVLFLIPLQAEVHQDETQNLTGSELYLSGQYLDAAARFLDDALKNSWKEKVSNYYNAARSYHQDFLENRNPDSLDRAVSGYYRVLDYIPEHEEARINLELARLEQEKLKREEENKADDQQNKDQQNKDTGEGQGQDSSERNQSSLDELAGKQRELSESSPSQDNASRQKELSEKTREALEESENQQTEEALEKALEEQQQALDQMKEGNDSGAKESQKAAARALEEAAAAAESGGDEESKDPLPEDLQSLINQEQSRNKNDTEEMIQVERNW